jgi:GTPase-activator protein for Ras-like GTPase
MAASRAAVRHIFEGSSAQAHALASHSDSDNDDTKADGGAKPDAAGTAPTNSGQNGAHFGQLSLRARAEAFADVLLAQRAFSFGVQIEGKGETEEVIAEETESAAHVSRWRSLAAADSEADAANDDSAGQAGSTSRSVGADAAPFVVFPVLNAMLGVSDECRRASLALAGASSARSPVSNAAEKDAKKQHLDASRSSSPSNPSRRSWLRRSRPSSSSPVVAESQAAGDGEHPAQRRESAVLGSDADEEFSLASSLAIRLSTTGGESVATAGKVDEDAVGEDSPALSVGVNALLESAIAHELFESSERRSTVGGAAVAVSFGATAATADGNGGLDVVDSIRVVAERGKDASATILRGSSPLTQLLSAYFRSPGIGRDWLVGAVGPTVARIARGESGAMEIDPARVANNNSSTVVGSSGNCNDPSLVLDANLESLVGAAGEIMESVLNHPHTAFPLAMRRACYLLRRRVNDAFPQQPEAARNAVQSVTFLRFLVPFIVSPESLWPELFPRRVGGDETFRPHMPSVLAARKAGGVAPAVSSDVRRRLLLVSKIIQQAVNGREYEARDTYFLRCNPFIRRYAPLVDRFLADISNDSVLSTPRDAWFHDDLPVSPREALESFNLLGATLFARESEICAELGGHADILAALASLPRSSGQTGGGPILPEQARSPTDREDEARYQEILRQAVTTDLSECADTQSLVVSGSDEQGRPVVVFTVERLPAREIDMEKYFLFVVATLDSVVERDCKYYSLPPPSRCQFRPLTPTAPGDFLCVLLVAGRCAGVRSHKLQQVPSAKFFFSATMLCSIQPQIQEKPQATVHHSAKPLDSDNRRFVAAVFVEKVLGQGPVCR